MRYIIILLLFSVINIYGQAVPYDQVPPSPNAARISTHGITSSNLSNGTITPAVPLFTLEEYGVPLSVTAQYSYRGYRPSELTGILGNGWDLLAGGTISRMVNGQKDERENVGFYHIGNQIKTSIDNFRQTRLTNDPFFMEISQGTKDSEPDQFYFNFGRYSGSFFYGTDGKFHIASQSKISFEAIYSSNAPVEDVTMHNVMNNFVGFIAKVEDGTTYRFFAREYSKSTSNELEEEPFESGVHGKLISAWHLSEIIGPNGQKITFEYSPLVSTPNRAQYSHVENYFSPSNTYPSWSNQPLSYFYDESINLSYERYLQRIRGTGWKLDFTYQDYSTNTVVHNYRNYPKRLTNISYYDVLGTSQTFLKGYNFSYQNYGDAFSLSSIQEVGSNQTTAAPYLFTYYGSGARPIHSKAIDHYGYFNGKTTNTTLAPAYGANREPVLEYARVGALNTIQYPTGGKDNFQYELNTFSYINGVLQTGTAYHDSLKTYQIIEGNFVIAPLIYINSNTKVDIGISVAPGSPTGCGSTYQINNYNLAPKSGNAPYTVHDLLFILSTHDYCFGTPSTNPNWQNITIALHVTVHYPYPTSIHKGPGIRISSITREDNAAVDPSVTTTYQYLDEDDFFSSGELYGRPAHELWGQNSNGVGYFSASELYNAMSSPPITYHKVTEFRNGIKKANYFFTSEKMDGYGDTQGEPVIVGNLTELGPNGTYHAMRSALKGTINFVNNNPTEETITEYGSKQSYSTNHYTETALYIRRIMSKSAQGVWSTTSDYAKFYNPVSFWFYPKKQQTVTYDANGQNPVTSTTDLYYDNPEHYQLTRQVQTNSDGLVHEEKFRFPLDYKTVSGKDPMLDSLINNHRHNTIIERTVSASGTVQDATAYTFAQFTGNSRKPRLFLPSKEYRFQASGTFAPYSGTGSGINASSYYENYMVVAYDTLGQAINFRDAAGIHTSVLRAYRARYTVGYLKNALKTDLDLALSTAGTSYNNFLNATDNTSIQNILTSVQNSLTGAQMSGFLYKPFVGMRRSILPNGIRTDYEYDVFGRLSGIKDHNGNWVSLYEYQLRGNNNTIANHMVSRNLRMATTNASNAGNYANAISQYEFFNAFGEPFQKVLWRQAPSANNIIAENLVRDNAGRVTKSHLPVSYASTATTPLAGSTVESTANSFYGEQAYSTITYRGVSDEVSQTRGAGTAWATNNKNVAYSYGTAGSNVRKYTINAGNDIALSGNYPANTLLSSTVTDEQGNVSIVYKDKKGQTVQIQSQISSGVWAVTYYIYDGAGRIRAVIQPAGFDLNSSIGQSSASFSNYVFCYQYDARGRVTRKHVPGAGWTEMVYDKNSRVVMHQNAYQQTLNKWNFTQYDVYGRVAVSGETAKSTTRASAQGLFDAHTTAYESRSAATYNGASFPSSLQPALNDKKLLNYYDDYTFLESQFAFNGSGAFHTRKTNIKGLLAGVKKRNSRDNAKLYTDAFYYDDLNRMIQSQHTHQLSSNNTSNVLIKNLEYNFAGEVVRKNSTFPFNTGTVTLKNKSEYDHAGRVTATGLGINAEPSDILHYAYDEIGRLKQKKYIGTGSSPANPCDVLTDGLVIGTWTVTGHPLVARYFHNKWWLVQRIGSSPDRFIVRGSEMISRSDVTLNNPGYAALVNCFEWKYSDFEGIIPPPTPSVFPVPAGYDFVNENGEEFFRASSNAPCSTPATIVPSVTSPAVNQQLTLTTSCATGTPKWSTNATTNSITITATAGAVTYSVTCQGSSCTTSPSVSITITGTPAGPCSVLTDGLVIGTWTVTNHPLIARYFHNKWWLVQRIATSPERFIVRASEMISRSDVTLNNSGYSALVSCFEWQYSNYGGLEPPATPSVFAVPSGYSYVSENGEYFFQANSTVPCSTPATIVPSVTSPAVNQQLTLTTSCATGTPKWSTNATTNSITITATAGAVTYSVTCQGSSCTTSPSVSITITGTPAGPCSVLTDGLVIGTWTVTNHPLIARYFHNKWWLVQRIATSPERFIVRASEMISRPDVTLNNSGYSALVSCFEWQYSNYGGLEPPATPSVFAVPSGYSYVLENGEYFFQKNSGGRIAAADFTGGTEGGESTVTLFPNPANDRFDVKISSSYVLKDVTLSITDMSGRVIYSGVVDVKSGENTYPVNSTSFSNGTYMVSLHKGLYRKNAKVVIMK